MRKIKKTLIALLCAVGLVLLAPVVAYGLTEGDGYAKDMTDRCTVELEGFDKAERATDGKAEWSAAANADNAKVTIVSPEPIGGLYMRFNETNASYVVSSADKKLVVGEELYLHEYVDVQKSFGQVTELTLQFHTRCEISEITVLTKGERPENMQVWNPVCTDADLLLFSSHSDDDQLFFAGVIPRYCAEGYRVQVAYLTNHPDWPVRRHELLDGLWAAGCKNYPVMGTFADFRKDDLDLTLQEYENRGVVYDQFSSFYVETIRMTKPSVVVSHDVNGEYGHGMHLLLSKLVREQTLLAADASAFPESARKYGVWQVKKTYIHLYEENDSGMVLDIDTPLPYFDGKTAFQVSQASFLNCHPSQHGGWYFQWQQGTEDHKVTSSKELDGYNPAFYGLYHSTVGADVTKTDFFENLKSKDQLEAEELEREQWRAELEQLLIKEQNKTQVLFTVFCVTMALVLSGLLLIYLKRREQIERRN